MKPKFVNDHIYHIYNRGVEKRTIFLKENDYFRFVHDLYEFNDEAPALNIYYKSSINNQSYEVEPRKIWKERKEKAPRTLLVDILAFCLMKNHFHLLLRQRADNGIVRFMQKLGTGYTMYFNTTYERVGHLFQGRFKAVLIDKDEHLLHLPFYIHANPLDIVISGWEEKKFKIEKAEKFLESYRWSSYPDYIGKKNFPSVTQREFLMKYFKGNFKAEMRNWLENINLENIKDLVLE